MIIRLKIIIRELKKQQNTATTVMIIVVGALVTIFTELDRELEKLEFRGRIKTIQLTTFLRSAKILGRVLKTPGKLPASQTPVKDHQLTLMLKNHKE